MAAAGHRVRAAWGIVAAVAAVVVVIDQATKSWAVSSLANRDPVHIVWTLQLGLYFNSGAAFSQLRGAGLAIVPLAVAVVVGVLVVGRSMPGRLPAVAIGAVVGGAVGNLIDRVVRHHAGAVVDFIDLQWFPAFNAADAAVTCGALALGLLALRQPTGDAPARAGASQRVDPSAGSTP